MDEVCFHLAREGGLGWRGEAPSAARRLETKEVLQLRPPGMTGRKKKYVSSLAD